MKSKLCSPKGFNQSDLKEKNENLRIIEIPHGKLKLCCYLGVRPKTCKLKM